MDNNLSTDSKSSKMSPNNSEPLPHSLGRAPVIDSSVFVKRINRPEHHRVSDKNASKDQRRVISNPLLLQPPAAYSSMPSIHAAPIPQNPSPNTTRGSEHLFGSMGNTNIGFHSVNKYTSDSDKGNNYIDLTNNYIDLTKRHPYSYSEPHSYVNPAKAQEELKALLQGVMEDQDDQSRGRPRRKIKNTEIDDLTEEMENLNVDVKLNVTSDDEDEDDGTVDGIKVKLLPHQIEGLQWMIGRELGTGKKGARVPKGGILADDMGLGKTLQAISLILTNFKPKDPKVLAKRKLSSDVEKTTLVVAPLALIRQWEFEIKDKVCSSQNLKVYVHHGSQRTKRFEDLKKYDVVITTYQIIVSEFGGSSIENGIKVGCFGLNWYRVILDEAHSIKNRNAKATRACYSLRSEYRWCLTGTPMQNSLDELQSLITFLRIRPFDDLREWKDKIDRPMKNGQGSLAIKRLRHYLVIFMKRRTKDILKVEGALNPGGKPFKSGSTSTAEFKITERKIVKVFIELSPKERQFYNRLESRTGASIKKVLSGKVSYASALVMLLRLRQACNHPKLVSGQLDNDVDAFSTEPNSSKSKATKSDVDDMADLLSTVGISVRNCEICQLELDTNVSERSLRCLECEKDLENIEKSSESLKEKKKRRKHHLEAGLDLNIDSSFQVHSDHTDEEQGEGTWLVQESERGSLNLGKAGGTDDENAEGGGEWLHSEDDDDRSELQASTDEEESDINVKSGYKHGNKFSYHEKDLKPLFSSSKISQLMKILKKESNEHKFIVFSQFTSMLDLIEPFMRRKGLIYTRYDGKMRNDFREASLDKLRNDNTCRVLLCSLKCGSLGLNLTAATRVVILEPFWNPFIEEQAIDRVHRLTQKTDVIVYKITIANSVEERILILQERKRELAQQTIEGGKNSSVSKLGMNEIMQLFRGDVDHNLVSSVEENYTNDKGDKQRILTRNSGSYSAESLASRPIVKIAENAIYGRRW